jgi:thioredoxin-like negative regulator of GroEL
MEDLFEVIRHGSEIEKKRALQKLYQRAKEGNDDPNALNEFAVGLSIAEMHAEAIGIFEQLIEKYQDNDTYRLNLATTCSQARQFDLCAFHLQYLAKNGANEEMRKLAQKQLEELKQRVGDSEQSRNLRQLQLESLREKIKLDHASADDYSRFGRHLLAMEQENPQEHLLDEITRTFEQGREKFPDDLKILEFLALCYSRKDPHWKLDEVIERIEKLDPNSQILGVISTIDAKTTEEFSREMQQRAYYLLDQVQSDDEKLGKAALQDLKRMVAQAPTHSEYRMVYTWALAFSGNNDDALEQLEIMLQEERNIHEFHFNVGQIFHICGDSKKGNYHLELSLKYAKSETQRQDAMERIAYLNK